MSKETQVEESKVEHKNIYSALSAFQGEVATVKKSGRVKFSTSKGEVDFNYSPLEEIVSTIKPVMAKHGLSYRHEIKKIDGLDYIEAVITHETYEEVPYVNEIIKDGVDSNGNEIREKQQKTRARNVVTSGPIKINQGNDMKDTGSAITYARRYSLTMALGIAAEDDKDAELFQSRAEKAMNYAYAKAKSSIKNAKDLKALEKSVKVIEGDLAKVKKGEAGSLGLTKEQYEEILEEAKTVEKNLTDK